MNILLFPPIAFILIFIFVYILFKLITPPPTYGATKSAIHKASQADGGVTPPLKNEESCDYRQFFPLAVFFTILHIAGLMLATWAFIPLAETIGPIIAYLISVIIILAVLFV